MSSVPSTDSSTSRGYRKTAGCEPLPGYKLLSPLGSGGFGEVWKCEAPGGLHKAIKFVASESDDGHGEERLSQELAAFEQIKMIRHPFLLTLERVEQVQGELVMVMELADRQLQDRYRECRICNLPGIAREELLGYLADAAEALDVISAKYGLQHLDIKPANLFLVSGHVKVGDYGLVVQLTGPDAKLRGLTPRYVAPEVLHGTPSSNSDQYSLALVYHELLTGRFPYTGRTSQQVMLQHVTGNPNLEPLPLADQPVIARALAKTPDDRFPSCLAFVHALMASGTGTITPAVAIHLRRARVELSSSEIDSPGEGTEAIETREPGHSTHTTGSPLLENDHTLNVTLPIKPHATIRSQLKRPAPPAFQRPLQPPPPLQTPRSRVEPRPPMHTPSPSLEETPPPLAEEIEPGGVRLERIRSLIPVPALRGSPAGEPRLSLHAFATVLMQHASSGGRVPQIPGDIGRLQDGTWTCQFPSTVPHTLASLKLALLHEIWGVAIEQPEPNRIVLRRVLSGGFFNGRKFGYEVDVLLPNPAATLTEVKVLGRTFGPPDQKFAAEVSTVLPRVLHDVRTQLGNVQDRRHHPRIECDLPVQLHLIHSDGSVDDPISGICRDLSLGGFEFSSAVSLQTKYFYAAFPGVPATADHAVLARLMHVRPDEIGRRYGAEFRADL